MTFIDDELPVAGYIVVDDTLAEEGLDHGHVQEPIGSPATTDPAETLGGHAKKGREPFDPLIEQGLAVDEHQRVDRALGDQPGADDRLAEGRGGREHSCLVRQQGAGGRPLFGPSPTRTAAS